MEEEFVPKKRVPEALEEKEEIKKETNGEQELKENKISVGRIISRIVWTVLILFVLFETVIGILNMKNLNEGKEPVWYFSTKTEKTTEGNETTYHLGLYVIKKVMNKAETKIVLRPFFLK